MAAKIENFRYKVVAMKICPKRIVSYEFSNLDSATVFIKHLEDEEFDLIRLSSERS